MGNAVRRSAVPEPLELEVNRRLPDAEPFEPEVGQPRRQVRIDEEQTQWRHRPQRQKRLHEDDDGAGRPALRLVAVGIDTGMGMGRVARQTAERFRQRVVDEKLGRGEETLR
jgi:hypothetical protein